MNMHEPWRWFETLRPSPSRPFQDTGRVPSAWCFIAEKENTWEDVWFMRERERVREGFEDNTIIWFAPVAVKRWVTNRTDPRSRTESLTDFSKKRKKNIAPSPVYSQREQQRRTETLESIQLTRNLWVIPGELPPQRTLLRGNSCLLVQWYWKNVASWDTKRNMQE